MGALDVSAEDDDLTIPSDDVPSDDLNEQLDDDHSHNRRLPQTDLRLLHGRSLGTRHTRHAHNRMDHACGSSTDAQDVDFHTEGALARPSLVSQTLHRSLDQSIHHPRLHLHTPTHRRSCRCASSLACEGNALRLEVGRALGSSVCSCRKDQWKLS